MKRILPGVIALLLIGGVRPALAQSDASLAPDLIFHNGKIVTVNEAFDIVEAVAIRDGRVVAVGSDADVLRLTSESTRLEDLEGKTMLPGLYDNHIHLGGTRGFQEWEGGLIPATPEWIRGVQTMDQLNDALRTRVAATPAGEWIRGALTRMDWPNQKAPTRWDLDEVAPDHPVLLTRGPHTWLLNSMAVELAGITAETPQPGGGEIIKDENGVPSGRLMDAAKRLAEHALPQSSAGSRATDEDRLAAMRLHLNQLSGLGITSVNIAGVRPTGNSIRLIQELYDRWGDELPRATMQVRLSPGYDDYDDLGEGVRVSIQELEGLAIRTGWGNDRLKVGAVKMSIDGGLSAPVFWSTEPYESRPDFYGVVRIPAEAFYPVAKRAHELGWQLGIHTMGDGAVVMVVDELERVLRENPREDHRHYLHHVAVKPPDETIRKMAELGIGVASQPAFTVGLGAFAVEALSEEREATQNPTKSLLDAGVWMSYGSDSAPYGPMIGMWTGVTRRGWENAVFGPEEAVSVEEAIRLYTMGSAYQTFDEDVKGSLEVGKYADMVVLSEDILTIDPERIKDIRIEKTIIGGREVYAASRPTTSDSGRSGRSGR